MADLFGTSKAIRLEVILCLRSLQTSLLVDTVDELKLQLPYQGDVITAFVSSCVPMELT